MIKVSPTYVGLISNALQIINDDIRWAKGGAEHELQVVNDDMLHAELVHSKLHRIQDLVNLRAAKEPGNAQGNQGA